MALANEGDGPAGVRQGAGMDDRKECPKGGAQANPWKDRHKRSDVMTHKEL